MFTLTDFLPSIIFYLNPYAESYLQADRILQIAQENRVQAIHPGYGFLSENAAFATACEAAHIAFIGPTPAQLQQFGLKHTARSIAAENGIPMLTGSELLESLAQAETIADRIGYPVMLKSTAGGNYQRTKGILTVCSPTKCWRRRVSIAENDIEARQSNSFSHPFGKSLRHKSAIESYNNLPIARLGSISIRQHRRRNRRN